MKNQTEANMNNGESMSESDSLLGTAIRESASTDLPKSDPKLREAVLNALKTEPKAPLKTAGSTFLRSRVLWLSISTAGMVLVVLFVVRGEEASRTKEASRRTQAANEQRQLSLGGHNYHETYSVLPPTEKSELNEIEEVLITDSNSQHWRSMSSELLDVVPQKNGEVAELVKEQARPVPLSESKTQTYSVQVPYTENVDGKAVTKYRAELRTQSFAVPSREEMSSAMMMGPMGPGTSSMEGLDIAGLTGFDPAHGGRSEQIMLGAAINADAGNQVQQEMLRKTPGRHRSEQYEPIHENPFIVPNGEDALSTFSIDVDTASYSNIRRFLNSGRLPPPNAVRIEELINYFSYDDPQPAGDDPFSVNMEVAACPWNPGNRLLRIGLKGKEIAQQERPVSNLVFLLDVSGSMQSADKLPLLKRGMKMLVGQLGENDTVSIVTYASGTGVKLQPTNGTDKATIKRAIDSLSAGGSTHGSAGIELAYQQAELGFLKDGTNRVILATDGDLNVGITADDQLVNLIKKKAASDIFLTVLGFGTGNLKDAKMEKLADNGNGNYAYIDSVREARKVLVQQMSGSLVTIARDVKLQLEFNPAQVRAYRLIGYENRVLAARDFNDDKKDAGEIGAGHSVTAFYEIVPTNAVGGEEGTGPAKKLKYQQQVEVKVSRPKTELTEAAGSDELLTLALRYKQPDANESKKIEFTVADEGVAFAEASENFRFASSVASFGMLLRNSSHRGSASLSFVEEAAANSLGSDANGYRAEFLDLVRRASQLK